MASAGVQIGRFAAGIRISRVQQAEPGGGGRI